MLTFSLSNVFYFPCTKLYYVAAAIQKKLEKLHTGSDEGVLYCKAIRTGKTEILICKTKKEWKCTKIEDENVKKINRIVGGKLIKDECNKDALICQEIKFDDCDHSKEEEERKMHEMISKARLSPIIKPTTVFVDNKVVCFEKKQNDKLQLECQLMQVKELRDGNKVDFQQ